MNFKSPFVIISNNCWGYQLYRKNNIAYRTPFIGLFLYPRCYIGLLRRFDYYMNLELTESMFIGKSKYRDRLSNYPIALLDDIEIHFMHYKNESEAVEKWNRRRLRALSCPRDNFFFKFDDRHCDDEDLIRDFHNLPFGHKISFTEKSYPYANNFTTYFNKTPDGASLYSMHRLYFDLECWINSGEIVPSRLYRFRSVFSSSRGLK